ncbi:MAG: DUF2779 domain-containing protein [Methylococcaceae bacterium]
MPGLSKSRLLARRQCPKRLWLHIYKSELLSVSDNTTKVRFNTGNRVGEIARSLYPGGVLIDGSNLQQALRDTSEILVKSPARPIFEATFEHDGQLIRADLLLPEADGYRLVEVKSSASVKSYHLIDTAIQNWVVQKNGLTVIDTAIAHIDTRFVYSGNGDYRGLLKETSIAAKLTPILVEVPNWVAAAQATLNGDEPIIAPGFQCETPFTCPFFWHCNPDALKNKAQLAYPPEDLPQHNGLAAQLREEGYDDLRQVPPERLTKHLHQRVHTSVLSGVTFLDPSARSQLVDLAYPHFYLDFETYAPAIPIWAGTRPFVTQIPFQWSCHSENANEQLAHQAFLAEGAGDPRREFIDSLLPILGKVGAIFVYSADFERSRLREMAAMFPDLAVSVNDVIVRIVDLLPIARAHYYHPDQHGSWPIKSILQTIAPELAYDDLMVADGRMAQSAFQEIINPNTTDEQRKTLRQGLLDYCERDTLAMVKIVSFFSAGESAT